MSEAKNNSVESTPTGPIVGIDLGTTNSVVAALIDGKLQVLAEDGEQIMPSVVGLDNAGTLITGTIARNQLAAFPDRTVASIKRKMGTLEPVKLGDQSFTPPEISAMILKRLCDRASRVLGQPVKRAVITVPAFFDETQRQATREAGKLAGLNVERIINEPTAATLVYYSGTQDQRHIVVYDFGGGTFDVSIVRMEAGVVEVLSSKGDTHLGGDDLDEILANHVADEFKDEHGIDLRRDQATKYRLFQTCEKAKCALSEFESVEIAEEFITEIDGQPVNLKTTVTRAEYESLIAPLIDRTIDSVDEALREVGLTVHQIDDLVLVGGSTRTPLVCSRLREEFLREPSRAVDPDLAVALGAAAQAAALSGTSVGPVLVDVATHTLGIEALVNFGMGPQLIFSPILHRNTPLPARYEERYSKISDEQDVATVHILQGEHQQVDRNKSIGSFDIQLAKGGGAHNKIVVCFELTLDGTLKVTATQPASNYSEKLVIDNALSQFNNQNREQVEARLGAMFDASAELLGDHELPPAHRWQSDEVQASPESDAKLATKYPAACALLKQLQDVRSNLAADDANDIRELASDLRKSMAEGDDVRVSELCEELDDILFYVN